VLSRAAESAREQCGLRYVAIFRHASGSHSALEELARASTLDVEEMRRVRAAGHAAVRGMRRFARRAVALEGGIYVVAAEAVNGEVAAVIAVGAPHARLPAGANAALVDLAQVAARCLSDAPAVTGYGTRFADMLAFLQRPPILAQSRGRLALAVQQRHAAVGDAAEIVETDLGLAMAVLYAANALPRGGNEGVASITGAIVALGPRATLRLAESLPTLSPATARDRLAVALSRSMAHSIASRSAADGIARAMCAPDRDQLRAAAALHDLGKLVLAGLRDGYLGGLSDPLATPEDRFSDEQRRFTIDHATIGALALRRLGLPRSIATLVDRHHSDDDATGVAIIRLADMLAHLSRGDPVSSDVLVALSRRLSLDEEALDSIVYDLQRTRGARMPEGPSPLTLKQQRALRGLAEGKRYKQIASDLGLAESTVRSHVHNVYRKLGVADRAHAVLLASERGWI
jgi:putative nucleotidyltransferase with HDIG domain